MEISIRKAASLGLSFQAGPASHVFQPAFAREVNDAFERRFGFVTETSHSRIETFISKLSPPGLIHKPEDESYCSEEVAWSGWTELQQSAQSLLAASEVSHLLFVEAWQGAYLPLSLDPQVLKIDGQELRVASLPSLVRELLVYSSAARLPVEPNDLRKLYAAYAENDSRAGADMHIQTYLQLMLTAQYASRAECVLWVVK
jgi:hypothetical protein